MFGKLVKTWIAAPHPRTSDSVRVQESAFLTRSTADADAGWPGDHTLRTIVLLRNMVLNSGSPFKSSEELLKTS